MASYYQRGNSYLIRVYVGKSNDNSQDYRNYTWTPEPGLSQAQIKKQLDRKLIEFDDLAHAQKAEEIANSNKPNCPTLGSFIDWYLDVFKTDLKQKTKDFYKGLIKKIPDDLLATTISEVTATQLDDFYISLKQPGQNLRTGKELSPKTLFEIQRFINRIMATAKTRGLIKDNPAEITTKIGKKKTEKEVNYFQPDELKSILDAVKSEPFKYQLAVNLLVTTGMRKGELMGMKWSSIDLENGVLHINNSLQYSPEKGIYDETPKTSNSDRYIKLDDDVVTMLKKHHAVQSATKVTLGDFWHDLDYVFTQDDGRPMHPDSIRIWLDSFQERNPELPHMNVHAFRHTFVSILISQNVDIATISRTIGHSDITTTINTYTHLIQEHDTKKQAALGTSVLSIVNSNSK